MTVDSYTTKLGQTYIIDHNHQVFKQVSWANYEFVGVKHPDIKLESYVKLFEHYNN